MPAPRKNAPKSSLAGAASEQVRVIIQAAEATAAEIRAAAEEEAERIRAEARREATEVLEGLRTGVERLLRDLGLESGGAARAVAAQRETAAAPAPSEPARPIAAATTEDDDEPEMLLAEDAAVELDETEQRAAALSGADPDYESARLVALNMALSGAEREEVDGYLSKHFKLGDRAALLDEVYATVGR